MAHGRLVLSIVIGLTAGEISPEVLACVDEGLCFIKPGLISDLLRVRVTIEEERDAPQSSDHAVVVERCEVFNQHQQKVLAWKHLLLVKRI